MFQYMSKWNQEVLAVEIWYRICSTLCSRVDAISDDVLVELAVPCLYEGHGAPVRRAPKRRADYGANEVSRTWKWNVNGRKVDR
jgi:hypothetical protein